MKSKVFVLVTDGKKGLVLSQGFSLGSLPNETFWPQGKRPQRQNWPFAILSHCLYGQKPKLVLEKRQRAFGLPANASWYVAIIEEIELEDLYKRAKSQRTWWFRYADAKIPWTIKLVSLADFRSSCDANSAHCAEAYLESLK